MPLAALLFSASCGVAYALRPRAVARDLGWCDHDYPRWGGHTPESTVTTLRARRTGFSHMVGAPPHTGLRPLRYPGGGADTASGGGGKVPGGTIGWIVTVLVIIVVVYLIVQLVL